MVLPQPIISDRLFSSIHFQTSVEGLLENRWRALHPPILRLWAAQHCESCSPETQVRFILIVSEFHNLLPNERRSEVKFIPCEEEQAHPPSLSWHLHDAAARVKVWALNLLRR